MKDELAVTNLKHNAIIVYRENQNLNTSVYKIVSVTCESK